MSQQVSLDQVIRRAVELGVLRLRVSCPARVESYDPDTNTISAKPLLPDVTEDADGKKLLLPLAVVHRIPVQQPRGAGYSMMIPLQPGDLVTLLFADRSLDAFKSGKRDEDPLDPRAHDQNDAVAILGAHDLEATPPDAAADHMSLGPESSSGPGLRIHLRPERIGLGADNPSYAVALAEKARDEIVKVRDTLDALVSKFNAHVHPGVTSGSASTSAILPAGAAAAPAAVGSVASSKVKVQE